MKSSLRICVFALLSGLSFAPMARAEVVQLRSGAIFVGDVRLEGTDAVVVEARFPDLRAVTFKRDDLAPRSLYDLLDRRADPKDAAQRRELADLAARLDLKGIAVAEYRAVQELDPSSSKELEAKIQHLLEGIGADLLGDARQLLEQGNPRSAIMYLHSILELYPESPAAKQARALMSDAHTAAGRSVEVAERTVDEKDAPKTLEKVGEHLAKGDEMRRGIGGHESSSVGDQRASEGAIRYYEMAWKEALRIPVAVSDPEMHSRIDQARARARQSLVQAYLTAGTILLQRRSIAAAERYCNKACDLDPENKPNHELHRLILQAKLVSGGWLITP